MKSLKGERRNLKINMMFNRGSVKLPTTDGFCGCSLENARSSRRWRISNILEIILKIY